MKKILIIDDEPDVRMTTGKRLAANGYDVLEAADGPSGVLMAQRERPDLILLDLLMPGQDGVQTYHLLRQDPVTESIPIIFLTALSGNVPYSPGPKERGYVSILGKPFEPKELLQEIQRAFGPLS